MFCWSNNIYMKYLLQISYITQKVKLNFVRNFIELIKGNFNKDHLESPHRANVSMLMTMLTMYQRE